MFFNVLKALSSIKLYYFLFVSIEAFSFSIKLTCTNSVYAIQEPCNKHFYSSWSHLALGPCDVKHCMHIGKSCCSWDRFISRTTFKLLFSLGINQYGICTEYWVNWNPYISLALNEIVWILASWNSFLKWWIYYNFHFILIKWFIYLIAIVKWSRKYLNQIENINNYLLYYNAVIQRDTYYY